MLTLTIILGRYLANVLIWIHFDEGHTMWGNL
ncbi:hypothetical protein BCE_3417 [Bacillus cereus ATCC 10987]|uniref:Uncharacterized protein n=1 Tax=Bacillus cereus (strain ATCC 10987 / NRS 248) TaxID=222523 RepID=Q734I8_BACC1|nr:hypothetical protein BCE_3417 [Bacillus cereus ATCC 10987]